MLPAPRLLLLGRQGPDVGQDVHHVLPRQHAQRRHWLAGLAVADLVQGFPGVLDRYRADILRLVGVAREVQRLAVEAVTGGTDVLVLALARLSLTAHIAGRAVDVQVGLVLPAGYEPG